AEKKDGPRVITIGASSVKADRPSEKKVAPVKTAEAKGAKPGGPVNATTVESSFKQGEKVLAMWKDGKYYAAVIEKLEKAGRYTIKYTQYNSRATLPASQIKRK